MSSYINVGIEQMMGSLSRWMYIFIYIMRISNDIIFSYVHKYDLSASSVSLSTNSAM